MVVVDESSVEEAVELLTVDADGHKGGDGGFEPNALVRAAPPSIPAIWC